MYTHLINAKLSKAVPKWSSQEMGLPPPPPPLHFQFVCFCVYVCMGMYTLMKGRFSENKVCVILSAILHSQADSLHSHVILHE